MSKDAPLQYTLDSVLADLARADALQRVDEHADPDWRDLAYRCVLAVARRLEHFTTDEVIDELSKHPDVTTHEPRALGPVMMRAARENIIAATDRFVKSNAVSRHRAPKQVWRSLVYRRPE